MPVSSLTITINGNRAIDGFIATLNSENQGSTNKRTLQQFVLQQVNAMGRSMAKSQGLGTISSGNFLLRFTRGELNGIRSAAETVPSVAQALNYIASNSEINLDDDSLPAELQKLVAANLLASSRVPDLLAYVRPDVT
jgi:hypothetical protein